MKGEKGVDADQLRQLSLDLPAAHSTVPRARRVVRHFARLEGLEGREVDTLMLVASEMLSNAIDHGGGNAAMHEGEMENDARMHLAFDLKPGGWVLRVSDQGGGDPAEVEALIHPDGMPDLEDERGRGLFLLAQMVDRLEVERSSDGRGLTFVATRELGSG